MASTQDFEEYEHFVRKMFQEKMLEEWPGLHVFRGRKYRGRSGQEHQIDVSAELALAGFRIFILVECKKYRKRVGIEDILTLQGRLQDIGAHKGILVTTVGFQAGAKRIADSTGIALVLVSPDGSISWEVVLPAVFPPLLDLVRPVLSNQSQPQISSGSKDKKRQTKPKASKPLPKQVKRAEVPASSSSNRFDRESERIFDAASQEKLFVLIWGPGDPGLKGGAEAKLGYKMRCLIRDELKKKFPNSQIAFSEDIHDDAVKDQLVKEAMQAWVAHAIIILAMSRDADLELDHFVSTYHWFRSKAWLLVPQKYLPTTGFVDEVFKLIPKDQIQGYTPEEFDRCDVAKLMSVNIVTTVATKKKLLEA